ncbi:hypothetical protein AMS58_11720 [Pseudoalteromonas porphyrae]|uniref:DUF2914 domain-containing protein n=2 Tax=Pseudoalteromonas TaxID=53246 RepID=A0A0N0LZH3_9GAMM|nr:MULTISPECIES: DUF2914 domain-containing protein [Pseudoalteromonas]KPH62898.1 hypothetical protein ADS77_10950 [Pseudoalteromonas porphyrae]KPH94420.1 hypothetical protein AMS58_11720 [Pseudoalteromonas porphyrae]NNG42679.1 DUF2914 domain-containing protein [Pseudoalteromonas sp. NEC-BIFX-2020_002]
MKQKIVITANMRRAEPSAPSVTYQWHWKRIATVTLLGLFALVVFTYSLLGSVNAEQNDLPNVSNDVPILVSTKGADEDLPFVTPIIEQSDDVQVEPALITNNSMAEIEHAIDLQSANNDESELSETTALNIEADITTVSDETDSTVAQPKSFASTAHVASVALGAKIDTDKVSRAVLTRDVVGREPVNVLKADIRIGEFVDTIAFFSELKNLQGQKVTHVWRYENEIMASIELDVTSPRYRTYSKKHILSEQLGHWRVDVIDQQGHLLAQKEFRILAR